MVYHEPSNRYRRCFHSIKRYFFYQRSKNITYDQINVGDQASFQKTVTESDVCLFAGIIGDLNPIHISKQYAEKTRFGQRIAHGMLTGSFFSSVFTNVTPGLGTVYISQTLNFIKPVFLGDTVEATVEVIEKMDKGRVRFSCRGVNDRGETVVTGEAVLLPPKA